MGFLDGLKAVGGGFISGLENFGKNMTDFGAKIVTTVGNGFDTLLDKGTTVANTIISTGGSIINKGLDVGGSVVNKTIDLGGGVVNKGIDMAGGAVNTLSLMPIIAIGGGIYLLSHLISNAEPVGRAVTSSATAIAPIVATAL